MTHLSKLTNIVIFEISFFISNFATALFIFKPKKYGNKKLKLKRIECISEIHGYEEIGLLEQMEMKGGEGIDWGKLAGYAVEWYKAGTGILGGNNTTTNTDTNKENTSIIIVNTQLGDNKGSKTEINVNIESKKDKADSVYTYYPDGRLEKAYGVTYK